MSKPAWASGARTGPVRSYQGLKIFACEGLVCVVDERAGDKEGEFTVVSPTEIEKRAKSQMRPYRNQTRVDLPPAQRQRYDARLAGCNNIMECAKEARFMGDPSDPAVQAYWARHRRSSTVSIKFSPGSDPAGYPSLPELPRGKKTGRTAAVDGELVDTSNLGKRPVNHIHQRPQRKPRPGGNGIILLD